MFKERQLWRYRCPNCGSVGIYRTTQRNVPSAGGPGKNRRIATNGNKREIRYFVVRYVCRQCKAIFDTPRDALLEQEQV